MSLEDDVLLRCPHCGTPIDDCPVVDTRSTRSRLQRVQVRTCPQHPEVKLATYITAMSVAKAQDFLRRARNREERDRRKARTGTQDMVAP